ncbi:MAG: AmmeMemoRadiSam system protein A [Candidatus Nealsonbacteria bacterium CG10_big_fil_rev_8_21_14_0_10_36_24]|uniref:AmmeMemoRadiSam system protein A n=2 Tax=Candidatus Nealsoniibacteriota TaxID=1817911 RepID=A0A2H0YPC0_9BACT|nr:MAG: AmmeMemoRadiSam system protein A [Candidatus Nealsonbacteria bacterium CG10_big_fil_rev_8_21_14_0_10_36_24]PIS40318.1 MAG: AmmeMemoRadiSam system protein A [Candidatus Nealsonbacteria bacterium CG08_land_8_20_14_0_20_36_22]
MNPYVSLAKMAVESYVKEKKIIKPPEGLPEKFLKKKSGTFVTIEKEGQLRGCIGTYLPTKENIAKEIISNAIAAATEDYRFSPIQKEELPELSYAVYILNEPELVKNINELNPKKYGIIVKTRPIFSSKNLSGQAENDVVFNGHTVPKSGLLLPDLEGIDTIEQQISIAYQKGEIDPNRERIIIYRFSVEKYDK